MNFYIHNKLEAHRNALQVLAEAIELIENAQFKIEFALTSKHISNHLYIRYRGAKRNGLEHLVDYNHPNSIRLLMDEIKKEKDFIKKTNQVK